jgi:hypothetical protein
MCDRDYVVWVLWDHALFFMTEVDGPDLLDVRDEEPVEEIDCPCCDGGWHAIPYDIDRRDGSVLEHYYACECCETKGWIYAEVLHFDDDDLDREDELGALIGNPVERENDNGQHEVP